MDGLCSIEECLDAGPVVGGIIVSNCPSLSDCYAVCGLPLFANGQNVGGGIGDCANAINLDNACQANPSLNDCELILSSSLLDLSSLKIGPIPAQDQLVVEGLNFNYEMQVQDKQGRVMLQNINSNVIELNGLSSGIYLLRIIDLDSNMFNLLKFIKY